MKSLPKTWIDFLGYSDTLEVEYVDLFQFLGDQYSTCSVLPKRELLFRAFELTQPEDVKVVILGQDPYPTPGVAVGLAFSVADQVKIPHSLKNIFKELRDDIGESVLSGGDLSPWAEQGVLLLNTILTVEKSKPGSHKNRGWESFTDSVISKLSDRGGVVFILWGGHAKKKIKLINSELNHIIASDHPSPLSVNRGGDFFGSKPFSKANNFLVNPIKW